MREFVLMEVLVRTEGLTAYVAYKVSVFTVNEYVVVEPLTVRHDLPAVVANVLAELRSVNAQSVPASEFVRAESAIANVANKILWQF